MSFAEDSARGLNEFITILKYSASDQSPLAGHSPEKNIKNLTED